MKVVNMDKVPKEPFSLPLFTEDVSLQVLAPDSQELDVNIVSFDKGVRNKFHSHAGDQVLIVTHGKGIIATESEEKTIRVGDVIYIPQGEVHWHGASSDSEFSHIYINAHRCAFKQHET